MLAFSNLGQRLVRNTCMIKKTNTLRSIGRRRFVLTAGAALMVAGCSPLTALNWTVPETGYQQIPGLAYGDDPRQVLDLYIPDTPAANASTIIFFYGGSWKNGDRAKYRFAAEAFATQGYTVAVPDYRTYPDVTFPAFVHDGASVVRWLRDNATQYDVQGENIVLMGHSAGAHIAALLAMDRRYLEAAGVPMTAIAGLVGLAGPYDIDLLSFRSTRRVFETWPAPDDFRPTAMAITNTVPTLLLHGANDGTVPPVDTTRMADVLGARGADVTVTVYPGTGHIGIILALAPPFRGGTANVVDDVLTFLRKQNGREDRAAAPDS